MKCMKVKLKPTAWFKHGPYSEGEPMLCVFDDPNDDVFYSALVPLDVVTNAVECARRVKPLVWREVLPGEWYKSADNHYDVFVHFTGSSMFYARDTWNDRTVVQSATTLDEAKAACQKYHEVFVLSQLELV